MQMTLEKLTHEALSPLTHGFFTRRGGASSGIFAGLNCGQGSSDQSEAVALNRDRVAAALGIGARALLGVHQIHSPDVVTVTEVWDRAPKAVLGNTVAAMVALGARADRISAVIGPTISQRAYEVGPEFMDAFLAEDPAYDRFFAGGDGDRVQFDLPSFGLHTLREAGVGRAEWTGHCTYSDGERFFSYRRSVHRHEADYGRLISAIRL